jgi:hypothetical protein
MKYLLGLTILILTAAPSTATPLVKNGRFLLAQQDLAQCLVECSLSVRMCRNNCSSQSSSCVQRCEDQEQACKAQCAGR